MFPTVALAEQRLTCVLSAITKNVSRELEESEIILVGDLAFKLSCCSFFVVVILLLVFNL